MTKQTYHIAFGINNSHSKFIRVVINSILNNNDDSIVVHIIYKRISKYNRSKLENEIKRFQTCKIEYHKIDIKKLKGVFTGKWDISAWYRIFIPELLDNSISKILYLDSDTIVNGSLKELFSINMKRFSIAAVINSQDNEEHNKRLDLPITNEYFCSGVILMNLEYWRKHNLTNKILQWEKENRSKLLCPDQDALNVVCKDSKLILPFKYGYIRDFENKNNATIFHYAINKPWINVYNDPYQKLWIKYNQNLNQPLTIWLPTMKLKTKIFLYFIIMQILNFFMKATKVIR